VGQLRENLKYTVIASKASRTSENYLRAFNKWKAFASDVLGTSAFPVRPTDCALYLQHLLESSKSVATINCALYAFKWIHLLAGVDSPTLHPTVIAVKEGAVRLASQPIVNRKEPLDANHLKLLAAETNLEDLLQLRNLVMFILAFSGFLRRSELCVMRSRDVQFNEGYVTISIEKSKTDQLREGRSVVIAKSSSNTCQCSLLKLYMQKAQIPENSDGYLFRAISASGSHKRLISVNKPISYSTYRQSFKKSFANIVPDISKFSTHSARSGGATLAASSGVSERNLQRHGRWASVTAKNIYVKDSLASRLEVSKVLSL
jgi:integrase